MLNQILGTLVVAGVGLCLLAAYRSQRIDRPRRALLFIVLIELGMALAFAWSRRPRRSAPLLIGLVVGLAVLTKWWAAMLVVPVLVLLGYRRRSLLSLAAATAVVLLAVAGVVGPWLMYIHAAFPREAAWEASYTLRHVIEPIEGQPSSPWYYVVQMPRFWGELLYLPLGWFLIRVIRGRASREEQALALWFLVPFVVLTIAVSKMPGYVMIAAAPVFLIQASFWHRLSQWRSHGWTEGIRRLLLVLLLVLPFRYCFEVMHPFRARERNPSWARALRALDGQLPDRAVLFGVDHEIEAMFSTRYTAYPFLPSAAQLAIVRNEGRDVAVCAEGALPPQLVADPRVAKVACGQ